MAIVSPPSVMVLIDKPKYLNTSTVIITLTRNGGQRDQRGAHVQQEEVQHHRHHHRRRKAACRFSVSTDDSMKVAWRMVILWLAHAGGQAASSVHPARLPPFQ
jgi:hypothetical protein